MVSGALDELMMAARKSNIRRGGLVLWRSSSVMRISMFDQIEGYRSMTLLQARHTWDRRCWRGMPRDRFEIL